MRQDKPVTLTEIKAKRFAAISDTGFNRYFYNSNGYIMKYSVRHEGIPKKAGAYPRFYQYPLSTIQLKLTITETLNKPTILSFFKDNLLYYNFSEMSTDF